MENDSEQIGINLKSVQIWLRMVFDLMLNSSSLFVDISSRLNVKTITRKNETRVKLHLNNIILTGWFVNHHYIAHQNLLEANNRV